MRLLDRYVEDVLEALIRAAVQVDFYHLAGTPLEQVVQSLAEKVLAVGGRLIVVARG